MKSSPCGEYAANHRAASQGSDDRNPRARALHQPVSEEGTPGKTGRWQRHGDPMASWTAATRGREKARGRDCVVLRALTRGGMAKRFTGLRLRWFRQVLVMLSFGWVSCWSD